MNFPGLDAGWIAGHRALRAWGAIRPWPLDECQRRLREGAGAVVVANTALGDSLLCLPLAESLSAALGPPRVGMLVRAPYRELYAADSRLGWVAAVPGKFRGLGQLRKTLREKARPPFVAFVANATEPDLVPWLWWCGARGFLRYRSRWSLFPDWFANREAMRRPDEAGYACGHAIDNNLAMAEAVGIAPVTRRMRLEIAATENENESEGQGTGAARVLVHPGASRADKCWPVEHWGEILRRLSRHAAVEFILTGSMAERERCERVARAAGTPCRIMAGRLGLRELAALQAGARLFLSGDTGPYHLALAVGCPTVTLFAPRDRGSSVEACGPRHADPQRHRAVQTPRFGDSIAVLGPDRVWEEILAVYPPAA